MIRWFCALLLAFGLSSGASAQGRWSLVWDEEFNYSGLPDSTKWEYERGFERNQEPQYYTVRRPENARVENGCLVIEARKEPYRDSLTGHTAGYTSASLITLGKESWEYGRIEVRAKVPPGRGSWPAFWMMGTDRRKVGWPRCGEVDIMEFLGKDPSEVFGTVHYADAQGKHLSKGSTITGVSPADGFHIYALEWSPKHLDFYYDDTRYFRFRAKREFVFHQPFYLLLNLALGHGDSWAGLVDESALPMRYYIDYVRVYRDKTKRIGRDSTMAIMKRAAAWQLNAWARNGIRYGAGNWVNAVAYTGYSALGKLTGDTAYNGALRRIAEELGYRTGPNRTMADDYCIGQTYVALGQAFGDTAIWHPFRGLADSMLGLPHSEPLEWKNHVSDREWAWCDALFMGPAGLVALSKATGDRRYLDLADSLWWKTTDYLYDPAESLYFRDSRFLHSLEPNGQPVFWSRGNGWVMAGLARVLESMPADYPDRQRYERLFQAMAARIAGLQQPDGTWHTALLDPDEYPSEETSGTGLYCYALAWGINHGLLSARTYRPVADRAWSALCSAVQADGMLGWVQRIGEKPGATDDKGTEAYGTGAFLLAGTEMWKFER